MRAGAVNTALRVAAFRAARGPDVFLGAPECAGHSRCHRFSRLVLSESEARYFGGAVCVASVEGTMHSAYTHVFRKSERKRWLLEFGQTRKLCLCTGKALTGPQTAENCLARFWGKDVNS